MPTTSRAAVQLILQARDEATKVIGDVNDALEDQQRTATELGLALTAMGVAGVAGLRSMAQSAMRVEGLSIGFGNLAEDIGSTAEVMLGEFHDATMGTLSDAQAMASANQLVAMQLANTSEEAAQLAEMAVTLGSAFGRDAGPSIEAFTLLMANQSIPRLDTFGISAARVRERILELQEATRGMSREEAFKIAVMEQGRIAMQRVGDVTDTTAIMVAQLQADFENLKAELGAALLPVIGDVVAKLREVLQVVQDLPQPAKDAATAITALATAFSVLSGTLLLAAAGIAKVTALLATPAVIAAASALGVLAAAAAAVGTAFFTLDAANTVQKMALREQSRDVLIAGESYEDYVTEVLAAADAMNVFSSGLPGAAMTVERLGEGVLMTREEFNALHGIVDTLPQALNEVTVAESDLARQFSFGEQQIHEYGETVSALANPKGPLAEARARIEEFGGAVAAMNDTASSAFNQLSQTIGSFNQQTLASIEQFAFDREVAELRGLQASQVAWANHHLAVATSEAQFQANVLNLQRQGKEDQIGNLTTAHEKELAQIDFRFAQAQAQADFAAQVQTANAELNFARQEFLRAVSHKAELEEDLSFFAFQTEIWLAQNKGLFENQMVLYNALLTQLGAFHTESLGIEHAAALAHIAFEEAKANASVESAEVVGEAIKEVIKLMEAAVLAATLNIAAAKARADQALNALRGIKFKAPDPPDFRNFLPDIGGSVRDYNKNMGKAKKATEDVTRSVNDFSVMIKGAIEALVQLAGFKALPTLADGAREFEAALASLIPMLRRLDDALDASISRAGMGKVQIFAQTIGLLAEAVTAMMQIAAGSPDNPFADFTDILLALPAMFRLLDDALDASISRAGMNKIQIFAQTIQELGLAVAGLEEIIDFRGVSNFADRALRFRLDLQTVIEQFRLAAEELDLDAGASVIRFSDAIETIFGGLASAVAGIQSIIEFGEGAGGFSSALGAFNESVAIALRSWDRWLLSEFTPESLKNAQRFWEGTQAIWSTLRAAVSALELIKDFEGVPAEVFNSFVDSVEDGLTLLVDLAANFDTRALDSSADFLDSVTEMMRNFRAALENMRVLVSDAREWRSLYDEMFLLLNTPVGRPIGIGLPLPPGGGLVPLPTPGQGPFGIGMGGGTSRLIVDVRASGFTRVDDQMAREISKGLGRLFRTQGLRAGR